MSDNLADGHIERIINVTNYQDHPTNTSFKVFKFKKKEQATFFETELNKKQIKFERGDETNDRGIHVYMFAVHQTDLDKVKSINYLALGKYRDHWVPSRILRWIIVLFGFGIITFAMVSYFMNK